MIDETTIIDADGHIMDWDDVVRPYMPEPYRRRALFYPLENWDRDLGGTLGKHWVRDLDTRLADMDRQQIDVSVLYPTVGLMLGRVREPEFAAALCQAYNDFRWRGRCRRGCPGVRSIHLRPYGRPSRSADVPTHGDRLWRGPGTLSPTAAGVLRSGSRVGAILDGPDGP